MEDKYTLRIHFPYNTLAFSGMTLENAQYYYSALAVATQPMHVTNDNGKFALVNPAMVTYVTYKAEHPF